MEGCYDQRVSINHEETEAPRIHDTTMNEETQEEDREFEEPQEPVDPPQEKNPLTRGNLLGYEKLSKVRKDMGLYKRITEKERGLGPTPGMQLYCVTLSIKNLPAMKKRKNGKNGRML